MRADASKRKFGYSTDSRKAFLAKSAFVRSGWLVLWFRGDPLSIPGVSVVAVAVPVGFPIMLLRSTARSRKMAIKYAGTCISKIIIELLQYENWVFICLQIKPIYRHCAPIPFLKNRNPHFREPSIFPAHRVSSNALNSSVDCVFPIRSVAEHFIIAIITVPVCENHPAATKNPVNDKGNMRWQQTYHAIYMRDMSAHVRARICSFLVRLCG